MVKTKIGDRMTKPRKHVLEILMKSRLPITAQEIHSKIKTIDLVSVYRTIELLLKTGVVKELLFGDGKKRYEIVNGNDHHHHLICENCGDIEDIKMKEEDLLKNVKNKSKFLIKEHKLEFFGLCSDCQ